jgi:tellurite resistance protein
MTGIWFFMAGLFLLAAGGALTTFEFPPPIGRPAVALSAFGAGGLLALGGLGLIAVRGPGGKSGGGSRGGRPSIDIEVPVMLHAIFEVASADDMLGESEMLMIELVSENLLGQRMSHKDVRNAYADYQKSGATGAFDDSRSHVSPEAAYAALKAATLVALSDGELGEAERARLSNIARRFRMPEQTLEGCIADARAAYDAVTVNAE